MSSPGLLIALIVAIAIPLLACAAPSASTDVLNTPYGIEQPLEVLLHKHAANPYSQPQHHEISIYLRPDA